MAPAERSVQNASTNLLKYEDLAQFTLVKKVDSFQITG